MCGGPRLWSIPRCPLLDQCELLFGARLALLVPCGKPCPVLAFRLCCLCLLFEWPCAPRHEPRPQDGGFLVLGHELLGCLWEPVPDPEQRGQSQGGGSLSGEIYSQSFLPGENLLSKHLCGKPVALCLLLLVKFRGLWKFWATLLPPFPGLGHPFGPAVPAFRFSTIRVLPVFVCFFLKTWHAVVQRCVGVRCV